MSLNIGRGLHQQNSILRPANNGIAIVAKNRMQQAVGMQNAQHIEALNVDGVDLQVWIKNFSGQVCTCGLHDQQHKIVDPITDQGVDSFDPFSDIKVKSNWNTTAQQVIENDNEMYDQPTQHYQGSDDFQTDQLTEDLIDQYAIGQQNSLLFGGDKTPCGICYGTGYKEGYQLFNGKRYVLDYFDNPQTFGFKLTKTYPYSYQADYSKENYITWKFQAPTFFKEYLGIRVRDNITHCKDYTCEISFDNTNWMEYDDQLVRQRNRQPTTIYLRIRPYSLPERKTNKFSITHIEVFYQLGDYIKGDFAPIEQRENWELFEALQTTSLELAGDVSYLTRESCICEPKTGHLWKVISFTEHMDHNRQIFKNNIELRMVQPSENLYCLNLINKPFITLNYRGLEQKQGMLTYDGHKRD